MQPVDPARLREAPLRSGVPYHFDRRTEWSESSQFYAHSASYAV